MEPSFFLPGSFRPILDRKACTQAMPLSAAASSSSTASAASLALVENRATTLAGWRTISLSKSTSFCCKTMFVWFCIYCLIGCTFDNRKMCPLQKMCPSPKMVVEKKMRSHVWVHFRQPKNVFSPKTNTCRS